MDINTARELMYEWVTNPSLRTHMEAVAACCSEYAKLHAPDDVEEWTVTGLLHDFDYEKYPTVDEHPYVGVQYLRSIGVNENICTAILGHADYTGVPRETDLAKVLFAVDELAGFIVAVAKVRPTGLSDLKTKSVIKKLKDKRFAAAVNRDDIANGIEALGVDRKEHIDRCITAIQNHAAYVVI